MSDISYLTIDELANDIVSNYHNKVLLVYANNGIGKQEHHMLLEENLIIMKYYVLVHSLRSILYGNMMKVMMIIT